MKQKKLLCSKCLESISPAQLIVSNLYEVAHNKIETAESLLRQIITTMNNSGLFEGQDILDQSYAINLLNQIRQNTQLSPSVNNIIASLGYSDVLRLLMIEIANMWQSFKRNMFCRESYLGNKYDSLFNNFSDTSTRKISCWTIFQWHTRPNSAGSRSYILQIDFPYC